jgi:hypothetical protein
MELSASNDMGFVSVAAHSCAPCVALRIAARPDFALRVYVYRFIDNVIPSRRGFWVRMRSE